MGDYGGAELFKSAISKLRSIFAQQLSLFIADIEFDATAKNSDQLRNAFMQFAQTISIDGIGIWLQPWKSFDGCITVIL